MQSAEKKRASGEGMQFTEQKRASGQCEQKRASEECEQKRSSREGIPLPEQKELPDTHASTSCQSGASATIQESESVSQVSTNNEIEPPAKVECQATEPLKVASPPNEISQSSCADNLTPELDANLKETSSLPLANEATCDIPTESVHKESDPPQIDSVGKTPKVDSPKQIPTSSDALVEPNTRLFRSQSAVRPSQITESPNYVVVNAGKSVVVIAVLCFDIDLRSVKIVNASQNSIIVSGTISPITSFPVAGGSNEPLTLFKSTIPLQPSSFSTTVPLPFPCNVSKAQMATFAGKLLITLRTSEEVKPHKIEEPVRPKIVAKPVTNKVEPSGDHQKLSSALAQAVAARSSEEIKPKPTVTTHAPASPRYSEDTKPKPTVMSHPQETKSKLVEDPKLKPSIVSAENRPKPPATVTPVPDESRPKPPPRTLVSDSTRPRPPPPLSPQQNQPRPKPVAPPRTNRAGSSPVAPDPSVVSSTPPTPPPKSINTGRVTPSASAPVLPPRRPTGSDL